MQYAHVIYDFADQLPRFGFMLMPLLFVAVGIGVHIYHKKFADSSGTSSFGMNKRKYGVVFGIIIASFAGLLSIIIISSMLGDYFKTKSVYDNKLYQTTEGVVENYHPMPAAGHDSERFTVEGVEFAFSDFDVRDYGYNNAASHGGAIREGLQVRIGYFNNGERNVILKLETE
jgi:hypothetical protein